MKCHHADVFLAAIFLAAILNAQPMGFYGPAQLVRDAREHGVEVRPLILIARNGTARWRKPTLRITPYKLVHGGGKRRVSGSLLSRQQSILVG